MKLNEFERRVYAGAGPDLKEFSSVLPAAIYKAVRSTDRLDEALVRETLATAGQLDDEIRTTLDPKPTPGTSPAKGEAGIKHTLHAHNLLQKLTPWTEKLREEGFGQAAPYFESFEAAAKYIEERSNEKAMPPRTVVEYVGERVVRRTSYRVLLHYIKPPYEDRWSVYTDPESYWEKLAKETERMEAATGFSAQSLVAHVLMGFEPDLPRARITTTTRHTDLPEASQLQRSAATVLYDASDLKDSEHRRHYNEVRNHAGGKGTNSFTPADRDLLELIEEMGGPPPKNGGAEFFRRARQRWIQEYAGKTKDHKILKSDSIRKRYDRLKKRLPS